MLKRMKSKVSAVLVGAVALGACDILDVENPNNLTESSVQNTAAAAAVVNGAEALVYSAISQIWQPHAVVSDELTWIGSRDAWGALDQGLISDEENEFTDAAFPSVGEARWMADEALRIIEGHIADGETLDGNADLLLARANLYAGIVYLVIGEVMEDFAFSNKTEAAPPVGAANMGGVIDDAIAYFGAAITAATAASDDDVRLQALMMRARAHQQRVIWDQINGVSTAPYAATAAGATDALDAIVLAGGVTIDEGYQATYSAATITNTMSSNVNSRLENNLDVAYVSTNSDADVTGINLQDPIDAVDAPGVAARVAEFRVNGDNYRPLNLATTRLMHLILAEHALANSDQPGFETHINHVRAMDGLTDFTGQVSNDEMLRHSRMSNLLLMGSRLADMYRWGITDSRWLSTPTTMLPIAIIEIRANCHLNGAGC